MSEGSGDRQWPRQTGHNPPCDCLWGTGLGSGSGERGVGRLQAEELLQVKILTL